MYRLLLRNKINKGKWYHSVICEHCERVVYLLEDNSKGTSGLPSTEGIEFSFPCNRCGEENIAPASDVKSRKAKSSIKGTRPDRVKASKSPRQSLWKVAPKAQATFGCALIEDRPKAASILARVIVNWTEIEVGYARLLAQIMGANVKPAAAVYGALRNSRGKREVLQAAANACLNEKDLRMFDAYLIRKSVLESERNDLAHGCFGISMAFPEDLIWASQSDYINFTTAPKGDENAKSKFSKKKFLYRTGTLERIAQEMEEYHSQVSSLTGYFWARERGDNWFCDERYPQLEAQPHILQALKTLDSKRGNQ